MLTIKQYISQMKKMEKVDEFNFKNHEENMAAVMKCVVEYFNTYLNITESLEDRCSLFLVQSFDFLASQTDPFIEVLTFSFHLFR